MKLCSASCLPMPLLSPLLSLGRICLKLPYPIDTIDVNKLYMEWRQHAFEEKVNPDLHWDEYWLAVQDAKTPTGEARYPVLMNNMLSACNCRKKDQWPSSKQLSRYKHCIQRTYNYGRQFSWDELHRFDGRNIQATL